MMFKKSSDRRRMMAMQHEVISQKERSRLSSTSEGSSNSLNLATTYPSPPPRTTDEEEETLPTSPKGHPFKNTNLSIRHIGIQAKSSTIQKRCSFKDLFVLQFPNELFGRTKEQEILQQVYRNTSTSTTISTTTTTSSSSRQPCWVSIVGTSGTGKTRLATFLKELGHDDLFLLGKYDIRRRNEPFVAFVHAFEQLCSAMLDNNEPTNTQTTPNKIEQIETPTSDRSETAVPEKQTARLRTLRIRLCNELGPEAQVLTHLIPSFYKVLQDDNDDNDHEQPADDSKHSGPPNLGHGDEIRNRFIFAVLHCIDIICTVFDTFILVLDDLQWADAGSLGLIKNLLVSSSSSSSRNNLMLVGCYRSNEVDNGHLLKTDLLGPLESSGVEHVQIDVDNLSLESLGLYIATLLSVEPSECRELTAVVHRKTLGNIFFVKRFLLSLFDDGLLRYNMGSAKWCWMDETDIDGSTAATENVVDLMRRKLMEIPHHVSRVLQFLACLGSEFDMTMLQLVVEFLLQSDATVLECTVDVAQICINNGLIESAGTKFRFIHDRVQESAIEMLPDSERDKLLFEFGQILSQRDDLEERLFTTVDLLNQGLASDIEVDSKQLEEVAKLNLRAGKRAMASAAFGAAASYFFKGIAILPSEIAPKQRLELTIAAAQAEFCEGHFDEARNLCLHVLGMPDLETDDRVRAQVVLVDTYTSEFHHAKASSLCLKFLKAYGCAINRPKDIFLIPAFLSSLAKTKSLLRGMTKDQLLSLPRVADPVKLAAMKILDRLANALYFADPMFLPLAIMLLMRLTVKHGVCAQSCTAFAMYSYMLGGPLGDPKAGFEFAKIALELVDRLEAKEIKSKTILLVHTYTIHRYQPVHLSLRPLELGYKEGMANGNMEFAYNCIAGLVSHASMSGKPLKAIEDDLRVYCNQAKEFQQETARQFMVLRWQVILNLMGGEENTFTLTGSVMSEEEYLERIVELGDVQLKAALERFRNMAAYYFGEYELSTKIISGSTGPKEDCFASDLFWDLFFRGLVWAAMARKTGRREFRKRASTFANRLRKLVKGGCPNCGHQLLTLEAEISSVSRNYEVAAAQYEEAIVMAGRRGFLQDHALSNELYGQFLCSRGETIKGALRISKAISLYEEWGAHAKVEHVKAKFAPVLSLTASNG